jgi:hypothetical protein
MWIRKVERDRRKGVISPVPTQMLSKELGMGRRDFMATSMGLARPLCPRNVHGTALGVSGPE